MSSSYRFVLLPLLVIVALLLNLSSAFTFLGNARSPIASSRLYVASINSAEIIPIEFKVTSKPNTLVQGKVGDSLSAVAEAAGVVIPYKCKKGECGTCEVSINGKWVKACQQTIPAMSMGETFKVTVKPPTVKKSAEFFSPKSFVEGVINNAAGVVGFINVGLKSDTAFQERMKREEEFAARLAAKKSQSHDPQA